ncbi:hypothetical protein TrRE_jg5939 [Triparma retinervis]|uniref:Uncharacterized protein n=1 Tax=Triparma retinervis TaxID=2557542 RepID=A0A9W7E8K1_9STRA|nr:hypothetical protein TrRE_jg5939 [Triparma retinervis]
MGRYGGLIRRAVLNSTSAGIVTVCFAGCLTHHVHHTFISPSQQPPSNTSKRASHALRVSLLTCLTFVLLGGTFQSTSPSSLFSPGAFARSSVPAPSAAYATPREKRLLISLYRKHGCHTCGTRANLQVIGDHVPPNVVVKAIGGKLNSIKQVFLPHCPSCSSKQGAALTRSLVDGKWKGVGKASVVHFRPRLFWAAGTLVANAGDWQELESFEAAAENLAVTTVDKLRRLFSN